MMDDILKELNNACEDGEHWTKGRSSVPDVGMCDIYEKDEADMLFGQNGKILGDFILGSMLMNSDEVEIARKYLADERIDKNPR